MERFAGKVALVTGAGGGIGGATAQRLADEGASVVWADVRPPSLPADATGLALEVDVTDPASCASAVAGTLDRFGKLDVLANVAGVGQFRRSAEVALDEWQRTIMVNLTGTFLMIQAALPALLESKGNVVNMASVAGLRATPYNAAYCASKGGVIALTRSLALEFSREGVRVNCVCPSGVNTDFIRNFAFPEGTDWELLGRATSPVGRMIRPDEVAGSVAYLASDEAAMVTGTALVIDGAATA